MSDDNAVFSNLPDRVDAIKESGQTLRAFNLDDDAPALALIYGNTVMLIVPGVADRVLNEVDVSIQVFHVGEPASTLAVHTLKT